MKRLEGSKARAHSLEVNQAGAKRPFSEEVDGVADRGPEGGGRKWDPESRGALNAGRESLVMEARELGAWRLRLATEGHWFVRWWTGGAKEMGLSQDGKEAEGCQALETPSAAAQRLTPISLTSHLNALRRYRRSNNYLLYTDLNYLNLLRKSRSSVRNNTDFEYLVLPTEVLRRVFAPSLVKYLCSILPYQASSLEMMF
ncbi:hypothetical protein G7046_g7829 [Stylonectria norvegica]|nr:hypothetical protein G7046_g7829 [Stylonectria norvegica]